MLRPLMRTIVVDVEEHEALPDGCCMRFSALDEPRDVTQVPSEGALCPVVALEADGTENPAHAVLVDDSAGGQSILVYGGAHGLRITLPDGTVAAEPYLLLAPGEIS